MKRLIAFVVITAVLAAVLSSCGIYQTKRSHDTIAPPETTAPPEPGSEIVSMPTRETENVPASTSPETIAPETTSPFNNVNIVWTTVTDTVTDSGGYTYEITYKISPFILISNNDVISKAWAEVGKDHSLPGFKDWGLNFSGEYYWMPYGIKDSFLYNSKTSYYHYMTDMYYCVGTVSVRNTTPGWDITEDNKRSPDVQLKWCAVKEANPYGEAASLCKVFYDNQTVLVADNIGANPSMKSNRWGPVPFIMMVPENFTPNYPDGQYYEHHRQGYFSYGDYYDPKEVRIGIIGKDGVYVPPVD